MTLYKITRFYADLDISNETVKTGLTLEEAQAHCQDPETSSTTCDSDVGRARTERHGPWFEGYDEQ